MHLKRPLLGVTLKFLVAMKPRLHSGSKEVIEIADSVVSHISHDRQPDGDSPFSMPAESEVEPTIVDAPW